VGWASDDGLAGITGMDADDACSAASEGATAVVVEDTTDAGVAGTSMPARSQGLGGEGIVKFKVKVVGR